MPVWLLIAALLPARAGDRPRAAARKAVPIHREAEEVWERCVGHRDTGGEEVCLRAYLKAYENATVEVRGQAWPAEVPGVPAARERLSTLLLDRAEASLRANATVSWKQLRPRLEHPGPMELRALENWLSTWSKAKLTSPTEERMVEPAELDEARQLLQQLNHALKAVVMPPAPWTGQPAPSAGPPPTVPRLVAQSAKKNRITDDARWFEKLDWTLPVVLTGPGAAAPPIPTLSGEHAEGIAPKLDGAPLHMVIVDGHLRIGIYGNGVARTRLGVFAAHTGTQLRCFDFTAWQRAPGTAPGTERYVDQSIVWAQTRDGVLYVSHGHRTHAASSMGHNAYLSAVELETGALLWQSEPLVCNSQNFVMHGDLIYCGYGFSGEPDHVTVVDRHTGALLQKTAVKTGPEYLLLRDDTLHVRTYDMDYTFGLR